jgi:hypothetical protein
LKTSPGDLSADVDACVCSLCTHHGSRSDDTFECGRVEFRERLAARFQCEPHFFKGLKRFPKGCELCRQENVTVSGGNDLAGLLRVEVNAEYADVRYRTRCSAKRR